MDDITVSLDLVRADERLEPGEPLRQTALAEARWWRETIRAGLPAGQPGTQPRDATSGFDAAIMTGRIDSRDIVLWARWHHESTWLQVHVDSSREARAWPASADDARALDRAFSMVSWPSVPADDLSGYLQGLPPIDQLVVLDVGHGSANALLDDTGTTVMHFDVGKGVRRNATTAPPILSFCSCLGSSTVVLSHWDEDHWAGATAAPDLLRGTWIVPRQSVGATHSNFARSILQAGGRIWVVKRSSRPTVTLQGQRQLRLLHGTGTSRNDSGQTLVIEETCTGCRWVLPGDARYDKIPSIPASACVLVASHHGAKQPKNSQPTRRSMCGYGRLVYSVGHGNSYGHPSPAALRAHEKVGWDAVDTRLTGAAPPARTSVALGWSTPPPTPPHLRTHHHVHTSM